MKSRVVTPINGLTVLVTGVITPINGFIILPITGRGPPCKIYVYTVGK